MKNCDEMVKSLLERRDRYEATKKKKKEILVRTAASLCCVGMAALLGYGVWTGAAFSKAGAELTPGTSEQMSGVRDNGIPSIAVRNERTEPTGQETNSPEEENYCTIRMSADWPVYRNVKDLTDAGNVILIGKIMGVTFEYAYPCLYTDYRIEVSTIYKGDTAGTLDLRVTGGIKGAFLVEQKAALGDSADEGIPIAERRTDLEIGQTYLFVLHQYEEAKAVLVNPEQSAFRIGDPLTKDAFSCVSVKDIISSFGEDKWVSFEEKNARD